MTNSSLSHSDETTSCNLDPDNIGIHTRGLIALRFPQIMKPHHSTSNSTITKFKSLPKNLSSWFTKQSSTTNKHNSCKMALQKNKWLHAQNVSIIDGLAKFTIRNFPLFSRGDDVYLSTHTTLLNLAKSAISTRDSALKSCTWPYLGSQKLILIFAHVYIALHRDPLLSYVDSQNFRFLSLLTRQFISKSPISTSKSKFWKEVWVHN